MSRAPEKHPSRELLESFMRGELGPAGRRDVVRHLLAGCPRCTAVTRPLWAIADYAAAPAAGGGAPRPALHPASYARVFERALATGRRRAAVLAAERDEAPRSAARLLRMSPEGRLAAVHRDRRLRTAALADLLVERSRLAAPRDPELAVELAETAAAVADRLEAESYGASVLRTVQARAWAYLGDARRLAGDLPGAGRALARSRLAGRVEDPADRAELLGLEASLAADAGRRDLAARLLDRAIALHRSAGELHQLGRALVQKAVTVACAGEGPGATPPARGVTAAVPGTEAAPATGATATADPAAATGTGAPAGATAAIALLAEGIELLDEHSDPRLLAYALHRRAELLVDAGRAGEAFLPLARVRLLYARLGDLLNPLRLRVLEGRAHQALGRPDAAESALGQARCELLAAGLGGEAASATLQLALLHEEAGRGERIEPLTGDLFPLLQAGNLQPGAMLALLVLRRAVEARRATAGGLLLETAAYLLRSRRRRLGAGLCWTG